MSLKGKIAVVTGGSRGIGKATALALGKEGCKVVICSKNKKNLDNAEKYLKDNGIDVSAIQCDLSKTHNIGRFVNAVRKKFGGMDILVNNAGVAYYKEFQDMTEDEINDTIDVNIRGLVMMTKYMLPMINKNGIVVNISSGAGKHGISGLAVYCASKFAVLGFTESLAEEGIKTIAVCPGSVDTDMYMSMSNRHPSLKPEHIAAKILEICTNPHKFRSGSAVEVYSMNLIRNFKMSGRQKAERPVQEPR